MSDSINSNKQKRNWKLEGFEYENGGRFEWHDKENLAAIWFTVTDDCVRIGADSGIHVAGPAMESFRSLV
jgi:hypothetical protein